MLPWVCSVPAIEDLGSVDNTKAINTKTKVNQTFFSIAIYLIRVLEAIYSPWIFSKPKPTVSPVKTKAHIIPAIVNISLVIKSISNFLLAFNLLDKYISLYVTK